MPTTSFPGTHRIASWSVAVLLFALVVVAIVAFVRSREGFDSLYAPAPVPAVVPMPITASGATLAPLSGPAPNTV